MFNVLRKQASSRWWKLPAQPAVRHNSTAYVPPAAFQHVRRPPPPKEKPSSPTFYTSRASYYDQVISLEACISTAKQALKAENLYPLPDFARASIPPPQPFWKDQTSLMSLGSVKMTPSRYRRVISLLNQLDEYKRIAEVSGANELADNLTELLSEFENDNKAAILASSKRKPVQFDEYGRTYTSGKRKESSARVWVIPVQKPEESTDAAPKSEPLNLPASAPAISAFNHPQPVQVTPSNILINNIPLNKYFPIAKDRETVIRPLQLAGLFGAYNVFALVRGGGTTGQSGAIAVGLARGLAAHVPDVADILRKAKLLRRDPRMVERKKTNLRKARAAVSAIRTTLNLDADEIRRGPGSSGRIYYNIAFITQLIIILANCHENSLSPKAGPVPF
ncbi:ribosomal protein S9/S16-domain-containing protein [Irpex rosettiformis]|uniref:Ribosomal protein S9/S16-domain-containing protein n=1 Tax=Irpex rosettiformis TaxID=378272 RepID=A0ACB8UF97_9APHY|nr:ribosomal protein S9/S16-domain-containing protein [Irpex rosettiformis]